MKFIKSYRANLKDVKFYGISHVFNLIFSKRAMVKYELNNRRDNILTCEQATYISPRKNSFRPMSTIAFSTESACN